MSLNLFKSYLKRRKLSETTVSIYTRLLKNIEKYIGKGIDKATKKDMEKYLDSISDKKSATIRLAINTMKIYFKWAKKPEMADFPLPKRENNNLVASDLLTEEEILNIINSCDSTRDKCLVALLYDSACRNSEIRNLKIEDIVIESEKTGYIVVEGKTGKRQVPLSFSVPIIRELINIHPFRNNPKSHLFLSSREQHKLSKFQVRHYIVQTCERAKIKKRVYPHLLRHSRLTSLDKKGLSHTAMKHFAGWTRESNMPSVYSHFSQQDTKDLIYQADGITPTKRKKTILEPSLCVKCNIPNDKTNKYCYLCGMALDKDSQKEYEIQEIIKTLIKFDPDLSKIISTKIKEIKSKRFH